MILKAVIFDLDGTVLSNEIQWGSAFNEVLKDYGIKSKDKYPHLGGIGIKENWLIFNKKYCLKPFSLKKLTRKTVENYFQQLSTVSVKEGFFNLSQSLKKGNIKMALATSSTWEVVNAVFDYLPMRELFDIVVTGDEVKKRKPNPAIFNLALNRLNQEADKVVVFEDSKAGVEAAIEAGIKVIGVFRDDLHKKSLLRADKLISDFTQITIKDIRSLRI